MLALSTRLLPHPPNFGPITDLYLGIHSLIPIIDLPFVMISMLGINKAKSISLGTVLGASSFLVT